MSLLKQAAPRLLLLGLTSKSKSYEANVILIFIRGRNYLLLTNLSFGLLKAV